MDNHGADDHSLMDLMSETSLGKTPTIVTTKGETVRVRRMFQDRIKMGYIHFIVRNSRYFDETYYRNCLPNSLQSHEDAVRHYCSGGWRDGDPSSIFSNAAYLDAHPDVKEADICPLVHYLLHGVKENRELSINVVPVGKKGDYRRLRVVRGVRRWWGRMLYQGTIRKNRNAKILVCLQMYYPRSWLEIKEYLKNLAPYSYDFIVTYQKREGIEEVKGDMRTFCPNVRLIEVENHGFDVGAFHTALRTVNLQDYDIVFKIHSKGVRRKRYIYRQFFKNRDWFLYLFEGVMGARNVHIAIDQLMRDARCGLVACRALLIRDPSHKQSQLRREMEKSGVSIQIPEAYQYVAGTCFAQKAALLLPFQQTKVEYTLSRRSEFSLAHCMERVMCFAAQRDEYQFYGTKACGIRRFIRNIQARAYRRSKIDALLTDDRFILDDELLEEMMATIANQDQPSVRCENEDMRLLDQLSSCASENRRLMNQNRILQNEIELTKIELNDAKKRIEKHKSSTSWKSTRLMRIALGLIRGNPIMRRKLRNRISRAFSKRGKNTALSESNASGLNFKIIFIGGEPNTSGFIHRSAHYCAAAAAVGAKAKIVTLPEALQRLSDIEAADIVVIWRTPCSEAYLQIADAVHRGGGKLVYDLDELLCTPDLVRVDIIDEIHTNADSNPQETMTRCTLYREAAEEADFLTATTDELARHLRTLWKPTMVLPNGFDEQAFLRSRLAVRTKHFEKPEDRIRIGYVVGTQALRRSFHVVAGAVARILRETPNAVLVMLMDSANFPAIDMREFPEFFELDKQIEWRQQASSESMSWEIARFDIHLAALEITSPFWEAQSELSYLEAALVSVCTIASSTGPFKRAIVQGKTGFLAECESEWYEYLNLLVNDRQLRDEIGANAFRSVLWPFGFERRAETVFQLLNQIRGGRTEAHSFASSIQQREAVVSNPDIPKHDILFASDAFGLASVSVVISLYNYPDFIIEAMESVKRQTLDPVDLIVVDGCSTDNSCEVALRWAKSNQKHMNRLIIAKSRVRSSLSQARNIGFELAETPYVMLLDADNRLLPNCLARCLDAIRSKGASFVYPHIQQFGNLNNVMGTFPYHPSLLAAGNYIDAMAMVAKSAWAKVDGYDNVPFGWEDADLWMKMAERGMFGYQVPGVPLAEYRVHEVSMNHTISHVEDNRNIMLNYVEQKHPWLTLVERIKL